MNSDIKARWVTALRSGEYEQGKDALRAGDKFCCLGVLCELAVQDGIIQPAEKKDVEWIAKDVFAYGDGSVGSLPDAVAEWAGLTYEYESWDSSEDMETGFDGDPTIDHLDRTLSGLNDAGTPFSELADLIEEHL